MAYTIYTAAVKNCCTACTAVHVSRTVLLNSTIQSITVRWFLFLYQVYSTTVVLPVLGVLSFFCFRCSYKTAVVLYSSTEYFFRLNLVSSSIYFVLNFELVVIYRGLLHCCTLVYTYVQQYYNSTTSRVFSILTSIVLHFDWYVRFDPTPCRFALPRTFTFV